MAASNPEIKTLPPDSWELVAEDMTEGFVHVLDPDVVYYQTYRLADDPAPDPGPVPGDADFEGAIIYNRVDRIAGQSVSVGGAVISGSVPLDIYIYAVIPDGSGSLNGRVRLDRGE